MMFKLSLQEKKDGIWKLLVHLPGGVKSIDYPDLETAIKELKRAIEIRDGEKK